MDTFRTLKVALAYAEFASPDIAGDFYKLIDSLECDIVNNYEPSIKTEAITEQLEETIEAFLGEDDVEIEGNDDIDDETETESESDEVEEENEEEDEDDLEIDI